MGLPGKQCKLCSKPGQMTVEGCESCGERHCRKHIVYKADVGWQCNRCSRLAAKKADKRRVIWD